MNIQLTKAELKQMLTLILDNANDGYYYGNKDNWDKRNKAMFNKILGVLNDKTNDK